MSSGTPSPINDASLIINITSSAINIASPANVVSPANVASPANVVSPVNIPSPVSIDSPVTIASNIKVVSPVIAGSLVKTASAVKVTSAVKTISSVNLTTCIKITSAVNVTSPVHNVSHAESPESNASTYSTVYSPAPSSSAASNIETDCCRNTIKVRRQRLRPWLINQINSGEIPGLIWLDKENMIFKIPWKHFGRPGVDMYLDALLFRRWALHTKKFEQGRPSDISTWKTRFRCALHKLPDIEELNDQNQTEGEDPYRVYKFRKIELEKVICGVPADDELDSSIGSVGSPVSSSYPVENTMLTSGIDNYRAPITSVYAGVFPKQETMYKPVTYPRKRHLHKPKLGGMATTDIQKWQYYDQMRIRETYPDEKSYIATSDDYDEDDEILQKMSISNRKVKEDHKYQVMDYETDDDDMSWNSRACIQINQPIQSVPSIVPRYPLYYAESTPKQSGFEHAESTPKQRGFEPFERRYSIESNEVGVIKNFKVAQKRAIQAEKDTLYEEDDNDLFFQSCAKRIKKLDTKSSGYLKLKILEHFYYVENFQQNYYNQSYRYRTDPPPLISNANARTTEQVIDVDDSMQTKVG